ncbi:MAG: DUF5696 domain-containing protein [Oscillospiraceae bacterium]|jgi:hypothetical protein|nr:DUF5696 domain-containing protein [Oscillospiraceae bacterium]
MKKKRWLPRTIASVVILLALAAFAHFVVMPLYGEEEAAEASSVIVHGYVEGEKEYTLENDALRFVMDAATTSFSVLRKADGTIWYSNPQDAANDPLALPADKANLMATLNIAYTMSNGSSTQFNNYSYSIERGIYEIEPAEDSVKVMYSLGKVTRTFVIPLGITESRMDVFLAKMENSESKAVKEYYRKVDLNKLRSTDNRDELIENYPDLEVEPVYILRDGVADYLKERVEGYFEKAGYSAEEYDYDMSRVNVSTASDTPVFNVSVIYRLDGNDLVVEAPFDEIDFNPTYTLTKLTILPNFGAGGASDEGFLFVPDGGGALINFNNGKTTRNPYYADIYGWDWARIRLRVINETRAAFPVFGASRNGASFICVMEDGAAFGGVNADISGRFNSYNTVSAQYTILHGDSYNVSEKSNSAVYVFESKLPEGSIKQRYRFLEEDGYVAMAKAYRDYLTQRHTEWERTGEVSAPVSVEIIGAVDKVSQVAGLPMSVPLTLTKYKDAAEIVRKLSDAGFRNLAVRYSGWMNGGFKQRLLADAKLIPELGNAEDLQAMIDACRELGVEVYLDGVTQFAYDSGVGNGFLAYRDAAKYTTREDVELMPYSAVYYGTSEDARDRYYLLAPDMMKRAIGKLAETAKKYGAYGVSFRDVGFFLSADYNPRDLVTREDSAELQAAELLRLKEDGQGVMIRGGNAYAAPYANWITDMDLAGAQYSILDEHVPFLSIALHGLTRYTGMPLNLTGDYESELLRSAEAGAGLNFTFMAESASVLQDSMYSEYYGADFSLWLDKAAEIYKRYNEQLGHLSGVQIAGHRRDGGVSVTEYEDGARVYVNFGYDETTVDGIVIPPRDYLSVGGLGK